MKKNKPKVQPLGQVQFPKFQEDYLRAIYQINPSIANELLRLNLEDKGVKMERPKNG